ncbi:MAG: tRNA (adenine-N(6)-)-methyltransferase [Clostridia bacterium]|nr:tRNA (adenine-N(6)-)-methyltransferase [Clostridia bacterium]
MSLNIGYLSCGRTDASDEVYTPFYAVEPILEFIPKDKKIWCPFDEEWSAFVQLLKERGFDVINSNLTGGYDFFEYEPKEWDIIVTNPPFSKKDKVLKRVYELEKPFALLLPIQTLQSKERFKYLSRGCEILCFDKRIDYHTNGNMEIYTTGNHFASAYFCRGILPAPLVFRKLNKYNRTLLEVK